MPQRAERSQPAAPAILRRNVPARLINLSQDEAINGCKKLSQRKIYCSAIQVTAWNTPGAH